MHTRPDTLSGLCLIDKNCLHQDYLLDTPATILFLGIANDMFTEVMDENVTTQKIISFLQSALMLLKELYENNVGSRYICKGLLLRIFRIMSSKYEFSLSREQRKTMNWILFEEVTGYIQQNYAHVTIQDLVREFHFQEDYFNRLIKSRTDMTYSAYVQQIRLEHAERLLLAGGKTIDEIARIVRCGICPHPLYEKGGVSPSSF